MSLGLSIAQKYAKALHALVHQKGNHARVQGELQAIAHAAQSDSKISEYFANPLISPDQKKAAIQSALSGQKVSEEVMNTLVMMAERNRISLLQDLATAYQDILDKDSGVTRGVVKSSRALSNEAIAEIESRISAAMKKKVVLSFKEDPKVLGGVVAQVGGWTFDDSIETHLIKLNDTLNRSAN